VGSGDDPVRELDRAETKGREEASEAGRLSHLTR
jgi:hypothetical protein